MTQNQNWYDTEKVNQKHSVILTNWMSERVAARKSAEINNSTGLISSSDPAVLELFGLTSGHSAVTVASSQRIAAVGACIGLIGDAMSTLPIHHYRRTDKGRERVENSKIWNLLNKSPIGNWTSAAMRQFWARVNGLRGCAITEIIRDRKGEPVSLLPWHPDRVTWKLVGNELIYFFSPIDGSKPYGKSSDDVIHIPGNGFDGEKSYSVISHDAKNSIGIALAADGYSNSFYENGGMPKHLFKTPHKMNPDQQESLRDTYKERYSGPRNAGKPIVLTEGMDMVELSMTSVDAQLLESRRYSAIDIARAFRVPPVLIGAQDTTSSWGSGVSEIKLGWVTFFLEPKANLWEQELNRKLISSPDEFIEHEFKCFMRGDTKAESEALRQQRGGSQGPGWLTLNEIRRTQNLPPVSDEAGGNKIYEPKGANNEQKTTPAN